MCCYMDFLGGTSGLKKNKKPSANAGDLRDVVRSLGQEGALGGGYGNPLQYSCLENPMDRAAWWATVHTVAKSQSLRHS